MSVLVMVDPVTAALGKDIASLVYRFLFKLNMADVNKQYRYFLLPDGNGIDEQNRHINSLGEGVVGFCSPDQSNICQSEICKFNWRVFDICDKYSLHYVYKIIHTNHRGWNIISRSSLNLKK